MIEMILYIFQMLFIILQIFFLILKNKPKKKKNYRARNAVVITIKIEIK